MPPYISADADGGTVTIDGFTVSGQLFDDLHCPHCASAQVYYDDYDAYLCPACNVWLEPACGDPWCSFCAGRPSAPIPGR
jgi:hypothetical protein